MYIYIYIYIYLYTYIYIYIHRSIHSSGSGFLKSNKTRVDDSLWWLGSPEL